MLSCPLPVAAQTPEPVRWYVHGGPLVSRLRYADASQRHGSADGGTDYVLGRHPAQVGATLGASVAIPVPPTGTTTALVLSARLAYNRRELAVHAAPYGPTQQPAYDARFRFRTVDAQVGLAVRHYLAPRRRWFWEAGPVLVVACQDYSRFDTGVPGRYAQAPGSNVLARAALGLRPREDARWLLTAGYARGLIRRPTPVTTSEDFAELTVQYQL